MPWECKRSGECCKGVAAVVVTPEEQAALEAVRPNVGTFVPVEGERFLLLQARPCPYYDNGCTVYSVRPYNCRRYACGREDIKTEPWEDSAVPERFHKDRQFRRQLIVIQRHAQRWARSHGWPDE